MSLSGSLLFTASTNNLNHDYVMSLIRGGQVIYWVSSHRMCAGQGVKKQESEESFAIVNVH